MCTQASNAGSGLDQGLQDDHRIHSHSQRNQNQRRKLRGDEKHVWFPGDSFRSALNTPVYFALKGQVTRGALQRRVRMPAQRVTNSRTRGKHSGPGRLFLLFLLPASRSKYLSWPVINRHRCLIAFPLTGKECGAANERDTQESCGTATTIFFFIPVL